MKKTIATLLVLSLIVALSACSALKATPQKHTLSASADVQQKVEQQQKTPEASPTTQPAAPKTAEQEIQSATAAMVGQVTLPAAHSALGRETQPIEPKPTEETQPAAPKPTEEETQPAAPKPTEKETKPTEPETVPVETQPQKETITKERAIEIALEAAGLTKADVFDLEAELDKERKSLYWEVDFETKEAEYSYDIHAYDGTIAKEEIEPKKAKPTQPAEPETVPVETQPQKETITKERAIEIALGAAGLTKAEVSELEAELEKERTGLYWEVSFETRKTEYSYEINAYDGTIVRAENERND